MIVYYWAVWIAPILAALILLFSRQRLARIVVLFSLAFVRLAWSSELWTNGYLTSAGCTGNVMKGLSCPDWPLLTRLAVAHQLAFLAASAYVLLVCPFIALGILVSELRVRIVGARSNSRPEG